MVKKTDSPTADPDARLPVLKTCKLYIGGRFPRTESGRYYTPQPAGKPLGNVCRSSRKDLRNAVVAARAAQAGWAGRSAFNRGQILYRTAEMLEGRRDQFAAELEQQGLAAGQARAEVENSIDRLIYFAGWCDKYQQIFSSVNPVASSHFNFSLLEPVGVVFLVASESSPLLGLLSLIAPLIASGNTCVVLASQSRPLTAVTCCEVFHSSDIPGGVINMLTGYRDELVDHFSSHLDINAIACDEVEPTLLTRIHQQAAGNVKRVRHYRTDWSRQDSATPYLIQDFCEVKTTWHPVERITAAGSGY